jgi:arginine exporter protein ArgO
VRVRVALLAVSFMLISCLIYISTLKMEATFLSKCQLTFNGLHGTVTQKVRTLHLMPVKLHVISHKTVILIYGLIILNNQCSLVDIYVTSHANRPNKIAFTHSVMTCSVSFFILLGFVMSKFTRVCSKSSSRPRHSSSG